MSAGMLPFVEAFGNTLQGEGPAAGRLADFVRFGGCNLSCSWCDSAYTWDAANFDLREEITQLSAQDVHDRLPANPAPLLIVTGGEPLINQRKEAFHEFLDLAYRNITELHVETNGTIVPNRDILARVDRFMVSPKLGHAGVHKRSQDRSLAPGWRALHDEVECHLKVVVQSAYDVETAAALADAHGWPRERVWVMPEGVTPEVLNARWPEICDAAVAHRINATHRLHVLAWHDVRGH